MLVGIRLKFDYMKLTFYISFIILIISCNNMSEIDKALSLKEDTNIIIAINEFVWKKSNDLENIENLTKSEKTFLYVEILESEINNGGFDQFFYNSSGDYAYEALQALNEIGAKKTANLLNEAYIIFPKNPIPKQAESRQILLEKISKETSERWNELEDMFYLQDENIEKLLLEYVRKNKLDFK